MRICLIIPPSPFLLDERVFMSLGILKIAAVLEQQKHATQVLDLSGIANYTDAVTDYCRQGADVIFGITATTPQLPAATAIARVIRQELPTAKIVLGGPHVTVTNAAARKECARGYRGRACAALASLHEEFTVIVAGDGEEAMLRAMMPDAPALIDADIPGTELFLTNRNLEELPFPARHLVDVDSYHYTIDDVRALSLIAQLGCPFECGFCGGRASPSLRRVRTRSSAHVVREIVHLHTTYGVRGFMLYDDELNVNPQMIQLMQLIGDTQRDLGVEFRLRGFIKAELFNEKQAEAMRRAGFRWILVGFESGSPRTLTNIQKKASRDDNTRCLKIAHDHGLKVKALMSIGHPGESEITVGETIQWLKEVRPDDFDITIITTYPGTPYYDDAVPHATRPGHWTYTYGKTGDRLHSIEVDYRTTAEYYKGRPDGGYRSFVYTDTLTPERLVELRDHAEHDVRATLHIPFNASAAALRYEHSMGQGVLPPLILRTSTP